MQGQVQHNTTPAMVLQDRVMVVVNSLYQVRPTYDVDG